MDGVESSSWGKKLANIQPNTQHSDQGTRRHQSWLFIWRTSSSRHKHIFGSDGDGIFSSEYSTSLPPPLVLSLRHVLFVSFRRMQVSSAMISIISKLSMCVCDGSSMLIFSLSLSLSLSFTLVSSLHVLMRSCGCSSLSSSFTVSSLAFVPCS